MTDHDTDPPRQHIAAVALLVDDYDEAIRYYTTVLGFELIEDTVLDASKRWVLVAPCGARETRLLLARATSAAQRARIGDQTGGRVFLFLHTDDFRRDHARLVAHGVTFIEGPRLAPHGTVGVFVDRYGNRWDLVERHARPVAGAAPVG